MSLGKPKLHLAPREIDKLGERLREGTATKKDFDTLNEYQATYDHLLIDICRQVDNSLTLNKFKFLLTGRLKRTKSIVRKLRREANRHMCLSQMGDILGLRVIVASMAEQERVLKSLRGIFRVADVKDYRSSGQMYRSLHALVKEEKLIEIQIRTLPQHVWAVESETFGEKVKEGTLDAKEASYLTDLSSACALLDNGKDCAENNFPKTPFLTERMPISGLYSDLKSKFERIAYVPNHSSNTFVVVYDNEERKILHNTPFPPKDRETAIKTYQRFTQDLSELRFECLIFNSSSSEVLAITHPRFYI